MRERPAGLGMVLGAGLATLRDPRGDPSNDPIRRACHALLSDKVGLEVLEDEVNQEIGHVIEASLGEEAS
jgi:hypothetical protein